MQDHGPAEVAQRREGVLLSLPRVDHDRQPEVRGELKVRVERTLLIFLRRVVAVVVESGLTDRDDFRVKRALAHLLDLIVAVAGSLVRMHADDRVDVIVRAGQRRCLLPRFGVHADRRDPRQP